MCDCHSEMLTQNPRYHTKWPFLWRSNLPPFSSTLDQRPSCGLYVYMCQSLLQASFSSYLLFPTYLLCHDYSEVHIPSHRGATISVTLVKSDKGRAPIIVLLINNEYFLDQEREQHKKNKKIKVEFGEWKQSIAPIIVLLINNKYYNIDQKREQHQINNNKFTTLHKYFREARISIKCTP